MPETSDLAAAVTALKPMGQWFLVHSGMAALVIWAYSNKPWVDWPLPTQIIAWSWPVATVFILGMLMLNGIVTFLYELWQDRKELPVAPKPEE